MLPATSQALLVELILFLRLKLKLRRLRRKVKQRRDLDVGLQEMNVLVCVVSDDGEDVASES